MRNNQKGMAGIESLLIVVIIAIIGLTGWYVYKTRQNSDKTLNSAATTSQAATKTEASTATPPAQLSAGSDNSSLQSDLSNINSSQSQAGSDSSAANAAVNDQQNEISVPTD